MSEMLKKMIARPKKLGSLEKGLKGQLNNQSKL